jgi:hypothetical protein
VASGKKDKKFLKELFVTLLMRGTERSFRPAIYKEVGNPDPEIQEALAARAFVPEPPWRRHAA